MWSAHGDLFEEWASSFSPHHYSNWVLSHANTPRPTHFLTHALTHLPYSNVGAAGHLFMIACPQLPLSLCDPWKRWKLVLIIRGTDLSSVCVTNLWLNVDFAIKFETGTLIRSIYVYIYVSVISGDLISSSLAGLGLKKCLTGQAGQVVDYNVTSQATGNVPLLLLSSAR